VRYGTDAATALRARIAELKADEPLAPVTVVVPSNQVGVSTRRLLASGRVGSVCGAGPGLIGVTFVTPYRLAELLGAAPLAAAGRRPVSTPVLAAAVRHALGSDPGSFGPVAAHAATESALVDAYRELRDLEPAALDAVARSGLRAAEVVRLHRATRAHLEGAWYDEEDLMAAASEAVAAGHLPADLGAVVVYLPQRLTGHAARLLAALGTRVPLSVLAGATGVAKADAEVVRSVARLGVDLGPSPTEPVLASIASPEGGQTRIVTASDADDEVRAAVRIVVDAVRDGTALDRIAVLYAAREPYARLLQHHLDAADVATNGSATLAVSGRLAGRTLLDLLALPGGGWRRQDLFAWLTGAPVLHQGRWAPTTSWERISRDAGVVAGRDDWDHQLERYASLATDAADRLEQGLEGPEDPAAWRVERDREDARRARELRAFACGLIDRLATAEAPMAWAERVRWAKQLLAEVLGGPSRRLSWPDAERRAAERVELALDRLAVLDHLEGPVGLDVFERSLAVELESDLGRAGRFGEGVLVGPVSLGVGVELDLVVVVGMAEGTFPSTLRDDSLLPDEDRDAAAGALPLRSGHVDRLHHQFLAALGGAARQVLCVPKGDLRRSRERVPSRWVLDVATVLGGGEPWWSEDLLTGTASWLVHHFSFDAALRAATPATDQEHRLRRLLSLDPRPGALSAVAGAVDAGLAAGAEAVEARASAALTRFDGNLAGLPVTSPTERGTSATALEQWAKCPHGYFVRHLLGAKPVEQPEDLLQISAIDKGNLFHLALERFVDEALAEGRVPAPATPWSEQDHHRLQAIGAQLCDEAEAGGLTGRSLFWQRDRLKILADLDRFLREDDTHRAATGASPIAAELAFGRGTELPFAFPLPDGRAVPLRGKADRVDQATDGTLWVLDYKTGSSRNFKDLSREDPHQGGRHLQLAVYGLAARQATDQPHAPVRAAYWFTSTKGGFEKLGYELDDEVLADVSGAMATIVDGIEGGLFAPHPEPPGTSPFVDCHACDPDGLGTGELRRAFERKLFDPALAAYVALIGADEGADDATGEEAPS
jgi:hypothetical protein